MKQKHDVIMAGIGGRGVLLAARTLAEAAMERYSHISWLPSMTTSPRGAACEATVVISNDFIASPLVWRPQTVVIMEASQLIPFIPRLLPDGLIITEEAGLENIKRRDLEVVKIPALSRALELTGETLAANFILLGAYVQASKIMPPELVETLIEKKSGPKNLAAFKEGVNIVKARKKGSK